MLEITPSSLCVGSAVLSFFLGFPIYVLLTRFGIIDQPNERSSHESPTARGGGVAFLLSIFLIHPLLMIREASGVFGILFFATIILGIVSFIDDIKGLPASGRLTRSAWHPGRGEPAGLPSPDSLGMAFAGSTALSEGGEESNLPQFGSAPAIRRYDPCQNLPGVKP